MEYRERMHDLAGRLSEEAQRYRALLTANHEHGEALVEGQAVQAQASLAVLSRRLDECRAASEHRHALVMELAAELGLEPPCSVARLLAAMPDGSVDARLRRSHAEVRELALRLRESNAQNQRLVAHRLDLLHDDFAALSAALRELGGPEAGTGAAGEGALLSTRA
jgi:hypothetical protein